VSEGRLPDIDDDVRRRLTRRFGVGVSAWFAELPDALDALRDRWQIKFGPVFPQGSMSVVIRCRLPDGRAAVLKVSPDRARLANEAAALATWATGPVPSVVAVDERLGALLIEAIEPGTPLTEVATVPAPATVAELLNALHDTGATDRPFPPLSQRIAHLFDSGATLYDHHPELIVPIPPELYERGRRLANRLAGDAAPPRLLHGDLTPRNILDGGDTRGLVAIDPAPCFGDAAFDAVDLVFWRATDTETIAARAQEMAPAIGSTGTRVLDWCRAFAAMVALELAASSTASEPGVGALLTLADEARA
jgi:streptomycin 6-kinase